MGVFSREESVRSSCVAPRVGACFMAGVSHQKPQSISHECERGASSDGLVSHVRREERV